MSKEEHPLPLHSSIMSDSGFSINRSNELGISFVPLEPTREERVQTICEKYPALTDQEIQ